MAHFLYNFMFLYYPKCEINEDYSNVRSKGSFHDLDAAATFRGPLESFKY